MLQQQRQLYMSALAVQHALYEFTPTVLITLLAMTSAVHYKCSHERADADMIAEVNGLFYFVSPVLADCLCILANSEPRAEHFASAKLAASLTTASVPASLSCFAGIVLNVAAQDEAVCSTRHSIAANLCCRLLLVLLAAAASCCALLA